ncbi:hypothetical protein [Chryseobacterium sp. FH1]|uniref:hypothetical protein n=1 Tax=Chryseobacterium sp. FH1 TaxID=1233951 RepID=UPI0004E2CCD8|nr:hypothetical protein [Chryseobacterium sp. FH1]KFC24548.1 hypothetical protein IO90_00050 [Chryseobacterium sp. FH1]
MRNTENKSENHLIYLKKVDLIEDNGISLKFDNLPDWNKKNNFYRNDRFYDYYDTIEIYFIKNISNYYLNLKRLIGEIIFIEKESINIINFWDEDFGSEDANTFDYLDNIEINNLEIKRIPKTEYDWKTDYVNLEKVYLELINKKSNY